MVAGVQKHFKGLSPARKKWFKKNCFKNQGIYSRKRIYCVECGHNWKSDFHLEQILLPITCPCCNKKLDVKPLKQTGYRNDGYGMCMDTCKGFQVVSIIFCRKFITKGKPPRFYVTTVIQHWIDNGGRATYFAKRVMGLSVYYDQWVLSSDLEIRFPEYRKASLWSDCIYPHRKYIAEIIRNGFIGKFHDIPPHKLFSMILHDSMAETLLKTRQIELLRHYIHKPSDINNFWPSIRICLRNHYNVTNPKDWFDHLELLKFFHKDLCSMHYICPENFEAEHNMLIKRKNRLLLKEKINKLKEKLDTYQQDYFREKSKFFKLSFTDGNMKITPLTTVEEFLEEGTEFGHCIFTNEYFNKPASLLLSAKISGERIETVEVSLTRMEVVQARGVNNKPTAHHQKIIELVNRNMPKISKLVNAK